MNLLKYKSGLSPNGLRLAAVLVTAGLAFCGFTQKARGAEAANLDQSRNGRSSSPVNPVDWVNGNAGESNAHYIEGHSIPYRMVMTDLTPGSINILVIEWDIIKGGTHAIDYITHYQRLLPHNQFNHSAETVNPILGITVSPAFGAPVTTPIPAPSSTGSLVSGQPTTSFNALPAAERVMSLWGGTFGVSPLSYVSQGNLAASGDSSTSMSITFTAAAGNQANGKTTAILAWGGHIGDQDDWGAGFSAVNISGSPYHTRLISLNGNGGNQDRSLSAAAVIPPPTCTVTPASRTICNGSTGSFTAAGVGGAGGPYSFSWTGPNGFTAITATISPSAAGTYTVIVKDKNGIQTEQPCSAILAVDTVTFTTDKTDVSCNAGNDGSITVTVTGGTPPFLFKLDGAAPVSGSSPFVFGSLSAGSHTVVVSDAVPCSATSTVTISQPSALTASSTKVDISCNGLSDGQMTITFGGGTAPYTLKLDAGAPTTETSPKTYSNLALGSHTVLVTDAHGCTASTTQTIGQPTAVTANSTKVDATCNGNNDGQMTVTFGGGTGPYTLKLDANAPTTETSPKTYSNLAPGLHTVLVTDAHGCTASTSQTIGSPSTVTASSTKVDITCNGLTDGQMTVTFGGGTGPYTLKLDANAPTTETSPKTYTGLALGSHTVVVTDAHGCTASTSQTIAQPSALTASSTKVDISCNGLTDGQMTVTFGGGTGPYTLKLDANAPTTETSPKTYTGLALGSHTVVVTDAHGCTASTSQTISQPTAVTASSTKVDISCNGLSDGQMTVTFGGGTGPYTLKLDANAPTTATSPKTYTGLALGSHTVVVTDAHGCTASTSQTISQPTAVTASSTKVDISCNGLSDGQMTVTFGGGTGPYTLKLDANAPTTETSPKTYTGLGLGSHTVLVTDAHGCTASTSQTINQPTQLTVSVNNAIYCSEDPAQAAGVTLTATPAGGTTPYASYLWSPGGDTTPSITKKPSSTTIYTVVVTDHNGCTASGSGTITVVPAVATVDLLDVSGCLGIQTSFSTHLTSGTALSFGWTIQVGSDTINLVNGDPGVSISSDLAAGTSTLVLDTGTVKPSGVPLAVGKYTIRVNVQGTCGFATQDAILGLASCDTFCSLTQGFYGNLKGKFLNANGETVDGRILAAELLAQTDSQTGQPGLVVGILGVASLKFAPSDIDCLVMRLPAGGPNTVLPAGNTDCAGTASWEKGVLLDKKGIKFRNNMLGQTIALALNTRLLGNLGSFTLTDDPICTQAAKFVGLDGGTPVFAPDSASLCGCGGSIPSSVITALGADPTVHGLLNLANRALAGLNTAPASLGDIHSAVGLINESFDECRSTCGLPQ